MGLALLVMVVGGTSLSSCKAEPPTIYCVFESGALAGGRCLTECESRCNLEIIAGCAEDTCVDDCEAMASRASNACLDASYTYWRCLRTSGQPSVTCDGATPVFTADPSTCTTEHDAMSARCPPLDAGTVSDAHPPDAETAR
ncbi:MAG TPA: hypothetical protein VH062_05970 [Polyangiaceae bacterium]|nr:hypothetical protein [Polyangiaceae bacterium]